jgi:hypothetical protein
VIESRLVGEREPAACAQRIQHTAEVCCASETQHTLDPARVVDPPDTRWQPPAAPRIKGRCIGEVALLEEPFKPGIRGSFRAKLVSSDADAFTELLTVTARTGIDCTEVLPIGSERIS